MRQVSDQTSVHLERPARRKSRAVVNIGVALMGAYAVYCGAMYFAQDALIFPGWSMMGEAPAPGASGGYESVWITTRDGDRVEAWHFAAPGASSEHPAPAVMYFHGNGELIDWRGGVAEEYARIGMSTLLVEYRGYGRSGGRPSQSAIAEDAIAFRQWLCARPEVDCDRLIYHGRSLGGGVAVELARTHEPSALVLESTFTSIADMALRRGVPPFLVRSPFHNDDVLPTLGSAVLILHGAQDQIITVEHGRRLHALAPKSRLIEMEGGHNDFPRDFARYVEVIREFLTEAGVAGR